MANTVVIESVDIGFSLRIVTYQEVAVEDSIELEVFVEEVALKYHKISIDHPDLAIFSINALVNLRPLNFESLIRASFTESTVLIFVNESICDLLGKALEELIVRFVLDDGLIDF